ncbi:MAG TPA: hypothetical protein VMN60_11220 [Longimicrobiales bacterium]|nr:hypothetical protein [Longimicrobiales bacterium]
MSAAAGVDSRWTTRLLLAISALAMAHAAACGVADGDGAPQSVVRTDSAGVEIVENHAPEWQPDGGWTVQQTPSLQIGRVDGTEDQLLHGVVTARYVAEGVLVAQHTELRFYNRDGALTRRLGGQGDGPGEFQRIQSAIVCDDRVWAADIMTPRVTAFDVEGDAHSFSLPVIGPGQLRTIALQACTDGVLAVTNGAASSTSPNGAGIERRTQLLISMQESDGSPDSVMSYPGTEVVDGLMVPFGRTTLLRATGDAIYLADTGVPEVRVLDHSGNLHRIIRLAMEPRPVGTVEIARIREQYLAGLPPSLLEEIEPRFEAAPVPDAMPYFSSLLAASDGTLWLRSYQPFRDAAVTHWQVIDPSGRWLGGVDLPDDFTPHEFGDGAVLGVWLDENEVEHVREYAVGR